MIKVAAVCAFLQTAKDFKKMPFNLVDNGTAS